MPRDDAPGPTDSGDALTAGSGPAGPDAAADAPWQRLDRRMVAVDGAQALGSVALGAMAAGVFGGTAGGAWPLAIAAAIGVLTAIADAYRWAVTRYRITDDVVELRTGLVVRNYRSVRRDRIRSVDVHAKLRHRLCGLRLVKIGAGQQSNTGEAAFDLDAVSVVEAHRLQALLLERSPLDRAASPISHERGAESGEQDPGTVLARFRPWWVIYNLFNVFAYVMALGLLWGAWWLLPVVGVDPAALLDWARDWNRLGTGWSVALAVLVVTVIGMAGMGVNFLVVNWGFELARVVTDEGHTALRTRQGLLTTREVSRDDRRLRGIQISEPLPWRWMGMADTQVVTTGLSVDSWTADQPTVILPRGPIATARPVAAAVLGTDVSPLDAPLSPHPPGAGRRRLWWATAAAGAGISALGVLAFVDVVPVAAIGVGVALLPVAWVAATVAYRALGNAIEGDYLVVRSGLVSRSTTALQRSAVSTIAVRESVLQRRLGLRTVVAMTSAGYGAYQASDLAADDALRFASEAAPGLLDPFLISSTGPAAGASASAAESTV